MIGPLAQIFALTCYGNASLGGKESPVFFPKNSTCQFCDSIKFVEFKKRWLTRPKEVIIAGTPNEWISGLQRRMATGIELTRTPQNNLRISDRMSAGFVGGGGTWTMEVQRRNGRSQFWAARWEVWDQNAPENRIWRVTYGNVAEDQTKTRKMRHLSSVKRDFKASLESIYTFSEQQSFEGFTKCFADALRALDDPDADVGYHKDLAVPDQLSDEAASMLKASMSAWVFGGMGSWNDIGFDGTTQKEYEKVSESLFNIMNEAIEVVANSTSPQFKG